MTLPVKPRPTRNTATAVLEHRRVDQRISGSGTLCLHRLFLPGNP
jgi:hypothetical protein